MRLRHVRRQRQRPGAVCAAARFIDARGGATAVEFAIVLPALAMFLFGIIEVGRAVWTQSALNYSVDQAARCASIDVNNCGSASAVQAYAAAASGARFSSAVFNASTATCGNVVTANYPIRLNIPFVTYSLTLTAKSCFPK
jgi:Flp pilus assembly protein TadG